MHEALKGVDVLIDETYVYDNLGYTHQTFLDNFNFLPEQAPKVVLRLDATLGQTGGAGMSQGLDWFEKGVLRLLTL